MQLKDETLNNLAASGANIAQFASFGPDLALRHCRIRGLEALSAANAFESAVAAIHRTQANPNVNIRTFLPQKPDGNPFFYGPKCGFQDPLLAAAKAKQMCAEGYHVIINETIDEADGGFSGVLYGDLFEFSSRDIPRCVEKPGCAALPRNVALDLIRTVYGFNFHVPYTPAYRVECSVHPGPVGYLGQRQVVWQAEHMSDTMPNPPKISWPNRYSRDMGDKAFGLLMGYLLGFPVPFTHVFGRVIPYFSFGTKTWSDEAAWVRTCPFEQQPGLFTTSRGWLDSFALMQREDPENKLISAILVQDGIRAEYAGAAIADREGGLIMEGKYGYGDSFMVGAGSEDLPERVRSAVTRLWHGLRAKLGDVRFEWVFDGNDPWVVQLHVGRSESGASVIFPGEPSAMRAFDTKEGLERLRELVTEAKEGGFGIVLKGNVGITSHFGDLLRRNKIPSRIERD